MPASSPIESENLLNGMITNAYLPPESDNSDAPPESDNSDAWVSFFKGILTQYDPGAPWDGNSEYGLALGYTFVNLLKANGSNLTRQSIVNTLETKGSSLRGPGLIPLGYSKSSHYGYMGSQLARIENSQVQLFGPRETSTNDGAIKSYTAPPLKPPTNG